MFERVIEKVSTVQELAIAVYKWPSFRLVLCIHFGYHDYLVFERFMSHADQQQEKTNQV